MSKHNRQQQWQGQPPRLQNQEDVPIAQVAVNPAPPVHRDASLVAPAVEHAQVAVLDGSAGARAYALAAARFCESHSVLPASKKKAIAFLKAAIALLEE